MGVSIEKLSQEIRDMKALKDEYQEAKKISDDLFHDYQEQRKIVLQMFEDAGVEKFNVPELGTAYISRKYNVRMPKDPDDKKKLFEYMKQHGGDEALIERQSINYQTLNSWFNEEFQAALSEGKELKIPGLEDPVEDININFRKE